MTLDTLKHNFQGKEIYKKPNILKKYESLVLILHGNLYSIGF